MRLFAFATLTLFACAAPSPFMSQKPFKAAATQALSSVPASTSDYFGGPWPDNRRMKDGKLPTRGFPNPGFGSLATVLFDTADRVLDGFGTNAPMYLPLSGAIDISTLPQAPADAQAEGSSLYVVALDEASPAYGKRVPLEWSFFAETTLFLRANTLSLRPMMGFPLEESTTYAIIMTTDVKDSSGSALGPDEALWNALVGLEKDEAQNRHYAPLINYLEKQKVAPERVALGVVFKTQSIMGELRKLYDYLSSLPAPTIDNAVLFRTRNASYGFRADYAAPYLLHGTAPYEQEGGEFKYDENGTPIPSVTERMRLTVIVPRSPMPAAGYPVVMYSHGTGGNYGSVTADIGDDLAEVGIASVGIDQVLHGPRVPAGATCLAQEAELCFFNPVNAKAGRNMTRQGALDHVLLKKLLEVGSIAASAHPDAVTVRFDPERIGYFGHSQGGLTGAVYGAIEHNLSATVLSGTGGHLMTTVLLRTDPIDLRGLAEGAFLNIAGRDAIGPFHPALALLQTVAEVADPLNYAKHWTQDSDSVLRNLYMTNGLLDPYTPALGAEALAAAAGLPQWSQGATLSPAHELRGIASVSGPLNKNLATPVGNVTALFRQFPGQGHFPVFDTPAISQWVPLFVTAFAQGDATIP